MLSNLKPIDVLNLGKLLKTMVWEFFSCLRYVKVPDKKVKVQQKISFRVNL